MLNVNEERKSNKKSWLIVCPSKKNHMATFSDAYLKSNLRDKIYSVRSLSTIMISLMREIVKFWLHRIRVRPRHHSLSFFDPKARDHSFPIPYHTESTRPHRFLRLSCSWFILIFFNKQKLFKLNIKYFD